MPPKRLRVYLLARSDRPGSNLRLQWTDPATGKRRGRSAGTPDPREAERARADLEYALNHGLVQEPAKLSWTDFRELYTVEHLDGLRRATRSKVQGIFERFAQLAGPRNLGAVDERLLSGYAAKLRASGLRAATVHSHLAYLRAALRWAERQGMIPRAPRVPTVKVPRKAVPRPVTPDEFGRLLATCPDEHWRLFLRVIWHTGLRRNEAHALRWERSETAPWVDLEAGRVWIPAASCKADADSWLPIHPELAAALGAARKPTGRVVMLPASVWGVSRRFRTVADQAGVRTTLHGLRRTFGSRYALTVPSQVLQRLMRHSSISTTLRYYASVEEGLEDAIRLL